MDLTVTDVHASSAASEALLAAVVCHERLALLLDLDGTLIPFAARTEDATLDAGALELLDALHLAGIQVAIVSGRPQSLLAPMCSQSPHVWWAAEHGTWRSDDGVRWIGVSVAPELADLLVVLEAFAQVPGARLEPKSMSVCLHWRLVPLALKESLIRGAQLMCDEWLETHTEHERIAGVEMLEVRRRSANKGIAAAWVRQRLPGAKLIAIGDDETDEDMFGALLHDEIAIAVGPRASLRSSYKLAGPMAVRAFLWWLIDVRTRSGEGRPTAVSSMNRR